MIFWDSSALVPLIVPEPESEKCKNILLKNPVMLIWSLTPTEIFSALARKIREGHLSEKAFLLAKNNLQHLSSIWSEVILLEAVRQKANRLLLIHPLRAADALQLAAALVAFEDKPEGEFFFTLDDRLASAAHKEGFKTPLDAKP